MIWVRFQDGDEVRFGIVEGESVTPVTGSPFGEYETNGSRLQYGDLKLLPPTVPSTFFCVGLNYRGHIEHAAATGNPVAKVPERPEIGYHNHYNRLHDPYLSVYTHYEGYIYMNYRRLNPVVLGPSKEPQVVRSAGIFSVASQRPST